MSLRSTIEVSPHHLISPKQTTNYMVQRAVIFKLGIIIMLCTCFMMIEIVGGLLANSLAVICDAFHLLSDLGGFIVSLISCYLATRHSNKSMNFGYRRFEVMGALLSIIFIWLLTGGLFFMAISRIFDPNYKIDSLIMITMASIGLIVNAIMGFVLSCNHNHSSKKIKSRSLDTTNVVCNSQMSSFTKRLSEYNLNENAFNKENKLLSTQRSLGSFEDSSKINELVNKNINIRAAFIHVMGDLLQSIGVLIAAVVIFFKPEFKIADPLCTIIFSFIVLVTTFPIMSDIINVLAESSPKNLDQTKLVNIVEQIKGIKSVSELKVWSLSTDSFCIIVQILIDTSLSQLNSSYLNELTQECKSTLLKEYNFKYVFIHFDFRKENSLNSKSTSIENLKNYSLMK